MFSALKDRALSAKEGLIAQYRGRIREAAIKNTKQRIALQGQSPQALSEQDLEAILAEEERKLRERLTKGSLVALLVFLGLH